MQVWKPMSNISKKRRCELGSRKDLSWGIVWILCKSSDKCLSDQSPGISNRVQTSDRWGLPFFFQEYLFNINLKECFHLLPPSIYRGYDFILNQTITVEHPPYSNHEFAIQQIVTRFTFSQATNSVIHNTSSICGFRRCEF